MTRRSFLQAAAKTILAMGFGGLFSSRSAHAATDGIYHMRQIITTDPAHTRMIEWDSPQLLENVCVELRRADGKAEQYIPAYRYLSMDGETQFIYHAEIPVSDGASYRVIEPNGATAWIPLTRSASEMTRALLFSDSQCGESYDVWREVYHAAWQRHPNADFAAIVGDLTDNGESAWHWRSFFDVMEGADAPLARHVHVPVLGNHEYYGLSWTAVPPVRYLSTFALPDNGSTDFRGHYYSFDIGSVHCIVLDTQFLELEGRGEALKREQMDWLMRDASASTAPWKIVLMHKDILSYGEYQTEQETQHGISDVGQVFLDTFDTLGIDLVVSGHVHAYRRRQLRTRQTDAHGTLYLLAGPAGNEYFDVPAEDYDLAAGPNPVPSNYLYMEADAQHLHIRCETVRGTILDTAELHK
ncbi:metallophosphoesterase [Selenomonas sp. oral taxon 138]|uniref:metallophosphoesterase family protein n=1 Tax=Selenomonas sp. oral taxon 138 TaxID=712532 RepID=UPI0002A1F12E|nr:metallophosphoesterase [Selenomonas sp. oral taxon 138]EKX95467.1 Tat pathway signal sequence domain protein [Selenomonas sp. oral taxon 138 str. F0429]